MQSSVEESGYCNTGVFFNVVNKAADTDVVITALEAGAWGGVRRATLWVCGRGACAGNEAEEGAWRAVWTGDLMEEKTTQVPLGEGVVVKAGAALGFLLHSRENGVCFSEENQGAEDGVLRVEPWRWTWSDRPLWATQGREPQSGLHTPAGAMHYAIVGP